MRQSAMQRHACWQGNKAGAPQKDNDERAERCYLSALCRSALIGVREARTPLAHACAHHVPLRARFLHARNTDSFSLVKAA